MHRLAVLPALLRRLRSERAAAAFLFLLVLVTATVFAAGPRLFNRVADDGLRHEVSAAALIERSLQFSSAARIASGPGEPFAGVHAAGDELLAELPTSVRRLISERSAFAASRRLSVIDPPKTESFVTLRHQERLDERIRYVGGRPPTPTTRVIDARIPAVVTESGEPLDATVHEISMPAQAADELGIGLGDVLVLVDDGGALEPPRWLGIELVGVYEVLDPADEYWLEDTALQRADLISSVAGNTVYATAYITPESYEQLAADRLSFIHTWRFRVDPGRFEAADLATLTTDLRRMSARYPSVAPPGAGEPVTTLITGLTRVVERYVQQRTSAEALLMVAAIGPGGVAAGAMGLVALLVMWRRRPLQLLTRARGASAPQLLGAQLVEGALITVPAALFGYLMAAVLIDARGDTHSALAAAAVALTAIVLLLAATLPVVRARPEPQQRPEVGVGRLNPRRLVLEGLVVMLAVVGASLLRERGLAGGALGEAMGADPFLAGVPVLLGVAVGMISLRLYPIPVRLLGWIAGLGRGLVPVLALRRVARQSISGHLPLLILIVTVAIAAFSSVITTTLDRAQSSAAWRSVAADYRITAAGDGQLPSLHPGQDGVEVIAELGIGDAQLSTATVRALSVTVFAIDAEAYQRVTAGTPVDARLPGPLRAPPSAEIGSEVNPLPAIMSRRMPPGRDPLNVGDRFDLRVVGRPATFEVVEVRDDFPGTEQTGGPLVVIDRSQLVAALPDRTLTPLALFVRAADTAHPHLERAVAADSPSAVLVGRAATYERLRQAPLVAAVSGGFLLAALVAVAYAVLAMATVLMLTAAARRRELAQLRALGLSARQGLGVTVVEQLPQLLVAIGVGIGLGLAIAWVMQPALGLESFAGGAPAPLGFDWALLAVIGLAPVIVVALSLAAGGWLARRTVLAAAIRESDR